MNKGSDEQGTPGPTEVEVCFSATMDGLAIALTTIDQFRAARNLQRDEIARARVVAEELITNTIKYGYGGECERPIRMRLTAEPALTIVYEDEAEPFDPTHWRPQPEWELPSLERPDGLSGIVMVFGLSSSVDYQPQPAGNRLVITFAPRTRL
jgi:serine/threonine-protein kinase RsbW